ncbi:MAG: DegT/DnrJ/EryC1/StrS family aminotransferase [Candidatus Eremiobacteraeota bacterium]|nr:DegT/DnrJ/EryC1/StrS family aminotransferase [Candidatus Eremiobacteraeota bacterium]
MQHKVEFFRHNIGDEEIARAMAVLNSLFLTTGEEVSLFESRLAEYLALPHAVGLTSATAGLHLSLLALGVGAGHEVITTPLSFVASANAILMAGARPVFVDVEDETGNIDASLVEGAITEKTRAILPVHLYGSMCDMRRLREIADRHRLVIVEDCAHALEASRDGVRVGHLGDTAVFSFYATKSITSGEGGAVATRHGRCAGGLKMLRSHGIESDAHDRYTRLYRHYDMVLLGWKYNMDNLQAALLIPQLARAEEYLARRSLIAARYEEAFSRLEGVSFPHVPQGARSGRHLFTIQVDPHLRDRLLWALQERNIGVAVNFRAIHLMSYYRETFGFQRGMFPRAERIGDSTLSLPLYPKLTDGEISRVIEAMEESLAGLKKG